MNAQQIFGMVLRILVRRLIRSGISAGINAVSRRLQRNGAGYEGHPHDLGATIDSDNRGK